MDYDSAAIATDPLTEWITPWLQDVDEWKTPNVMWTVQSLT